MKSSSRTDLFLTGTDITTETEKAAIKAVVEVSSSKSFLTSKISCNRILSNIKKLGYNRDRDDRQRQQRDEAPPRNDPPAEPSSG